MKINQILRKLKNYIFFNQNPIKTQKEELKMEQF